MSNILLKNALWHCRVAQADGSYKVDKELIDLFLQLFCVNKSWTSFDDKILCKIKNYSKYYCGKLMAYKIKKVKQLLADGMSKEFIYSQLD